VRAHDDVIECLDCGTTWPVPVEPYRYGWLGLRRAQGLAPAWWECPHGCNVEHVAAWKRGERS
jgi:hypothetical protein